MPVTSTQPGTTKPPKEAHLGLLTGLNGGTWISILPGSWLLYGAGGVGATPMPMLLVSVEPSNYGLKLEFACCNNSECTRRLKFEGKWNGRHFEQGQDEEIKPD